MQQDSCLKIAAIQFDINWLDKSGNLNKLEALTSQVEPVDLLLLPETFSTGFAIDVNGCEEPENEGKVLGWMTELAKQLDCVIAGSVLVENENKKCNRFYWVYPNGEFQYYDKRHLFRLGNEQDYVIAGNKRLVFEIKGVRILPLVCYDLRFPVWSRNRDDYDLMVNVANWPAVRRNVWDTLLKARAMENQVYVIGVNRIGDDGKGVAHSGGTAVYDFLGETLASAEDNTEQIVYAEIELRKLNWFKEKFPAYLDADSFELNISDQRD